MMKCLSISFLTFFFIYSCSNDSFEDNDMANPIDMEAAKEKIRFEGDWSLMVNDLEKPLNYIWGTECIIYAVGGSNAVPEYEHLASIVKFNKEWQVEKDDWNKRMYISSINGISESDVYAVGTIWADGMLEGAWMNYNGESWTQTKCQNGLNKISVIDGEIYVPGSNMLFQLIMDSLHVIHTYSFHGYDLWGNSSDNIYFVGFSGPTDYILHFDGDKWTNMLPEGNETGYFLQSIQGVSENEIYATGTGGKMLKFDGTSWEVIADQNEPISDLEVVGSDDVYFVTFSNAQKGNMFHFDGVTTQKLVLPYDGNLYHVWSHPEVGMLALGNEGIILSKSF